MKQRTVISRINLEFHAVDRNRALVIASRGLGSMCLMCLGSLSLLGSFSLRFLNESNITNAFLPKAFLHLSFIQELFSLFCFSIEADALMLYVGIELSLLGGQQSHPSKVQIPSSLSSTCPHWAAYQKSWPDHYCCSPTCLLLIPKRAGLDRKSVV